MQFPAFLSALCLSATVAAEQFVSLNLCSDRLLIELARPEQIAAMSPYSKNPLMMLDKVNQSKPTVEPQLSAMLPYLDKTVLINTLFYPQLVADLKKLGVKIIPLNDSPQTPEQLFDLIRHLGSITGNENHSETLIKRLKSQNFSLNRALGETLILAETGVVEMRQPQYRTLLELLGLRPLKSELNSQNFSLEQLVLAQPQQLITLTDQAGYSNQAELLSHPVLQHLFKNRPLATIPLKYTYCFDFGIWQGAEKIYQQWRTQ